MQEIMIDISKLLLAIGIGALIGIEREASRKPAGMRTLAIVSMASCLVTITAVDYFPNNSGRIISGLITGIGFLGAGSIIAQGKNITGLTTAASIWAVAILGIVIGIGEYALSFVFGTLVYLILIGGRLEKKVNATISKKRK